MAPSPERKPEDGLPPGEAKRGKMGLMSGVYIPVFLNILSILMFLRFGLILGQIGLVGILGLLVIAYSIDLLTTLSLSAIASNGEVKGGGAYYLISRSLGPEFGGSIGILFYLAQVLNTAMNVVGLIDCIRLNVGQAFPQGYWIGYGLQTAALIGCTCLCLLGPAIFAKASNALLVILTIAILSIPVSALFKGPFEDDSTGIVFTGISWATLSGNFLPDVTSEHFKGLATFRELFGILFPATSGIFAGASMSGDLRNPSKAIPKGTLWAMLTTFILYFVVIVSMASSTTHDSFLANPNIVPLTNLSIPLILAGECAVTLFSALMGIIGSAKLFQALAKDKLLPGLSLFGIGTKRADEPIYAILLTYALAQVALFADLNQIATLISMGYQMTFFVMNLACFLLKIGSAPNFRPSFQFFSWQTALLGALSSAAAMFFIEETYAALAICSLVAVFLLIHYLSPPKRWGDVSQNLIYHQVRKYLLRLKPEHIKFWRPHIILLVNDPRRQARLIQFCNSLKKGSLYILGHVIVTDDFTAGVHEARLQQQAWTNYISEFSRIKAFVQLTMSPSITWGIRNLILSAGLGGMRPNIAVMGFYNMEELRRSNPRFNIPELPLFTAAKMRRPAHDVKAKSKRHRRDTSARLLEGFLPTDVIRTEGMMSPIDYMTMLEDVTLQYRLNVGVAYGFDSLETPRHDGSNTKQYVDLWPIQMSAEVTADGKNLVTTNFDTYTLILQLGHILRSVQNWRRVYRLRVMVFVEYESEVDEERARVKALLEKLRIEADVLVFWLASGSLNTYELIINGESNDLEYELIVNEALRDEEWWDELQSFRGRSTHMSSSQELNKITSILDSTSNRPGAFNPHEGLGDRRRTSMNMSTVDGREVRRHPDIAMLSKMGVSMGIHTHHLNHGVFDDDSSTDYVSDTETGSDEESHLPWDNGETPRQSGFDGSLEPLLEETGTVRRRGRRHYKSNSEESSNRAAESLLASAATTPNVPSYGTMSTSQTQQQPQLDTRSRAPPREDTIKSPTTPHKPSSSANLLKPTETFPAYDPPEMPPLTQRRSRSLSPTRQSGARTPRSGAMTPSRPGISRQSSAVKFSSRPVPETRISGEDSRISFVATAPLTPRPTHSRQSSLGKLAVRPIADSRPSAGEGASRTIQFAAPHNKTDLSASIPELVDNPNVEDESVAGSSVSTQSVALSFNDLPSRAQHLILNELMKQNSRHTAVLLTTLPIPAEGTCQDQEATIQYLSDVEVLCNELPPTLMVLSNNMTVTVSL